MMLMMTMMMTMMMMMMIMVMIMMLPGCGRRAGGLGGAGHKG
jgi:hypothetical protein